MKTLFLFLFLFLFSVSLSVQAKNDNNHILLANNSSQSLASIVALDNRYGNITLLPSSDQNYVSFFDLDEKDIDVSVVGAVGEPLRIKGKLSFFKAQIDQTEANSLKRFLTIIGVKPEGIHEITEQLVHGVNSSRECKGNKSDCLVYQPEFITVVDFYNSSLRLFIPNEWFETTAQKIVLDTVSESFLASSWYGSISYADDISYYVRSVNTYGLGDGYIKYDFNISDSSKKIGQFNYNYDAPNYSLTSGVIANTQRLGIAGQNSLVNEQFFGVELSNQKLLEINNFLARSVDFFSPADGVLSVYKSNGDLIYQSNVFSGRNSIPYSYLPYGNYAVRYEVMNNENVVLKGDNFVSNSDTFDASEVSVYTRLGMKKQKLAGNQNSILFDSGISIPLYLQHSAIGSISLIEDEWFGGIGYYANIDNYRLSFRYSLGENAYQLNTDMYSELFNLSISNTNIQEGKRSYLGDRDSLVVSVGAHQSYKYLSFGLGASYNDIGKDKYLSYNFNSNYSFNNGISIYATYNGSAHENILSVGLSIPLSTHTYYNSMFSESQGNLELNSQLTSSLKVNNQLSLNGGVLHRYIQKKENQIDAYVNSNYSDEAFSGSAGIRRQKDGGMTYNGSFSTTAYLTENRVYFKDVRSANTSAIEVVGMDKVLEGKVKLHDKSSGRRSVQSVSEQVLLDMRPYTQVDIDYEFDNNLLALDEINIERNSTINMLPGKIHYLNVKQQPIGNVLIVSNGFDTEGILCTGEACIDEKAINSRVLKFRVKPEQQFSIHRNGKICFTGEVTQGQTKIGVCEN